MLKKNYACRCWLQPQPVPPLPAAAAAATLNANPANPDAIPEGTTLKMAILETTDIHSNVLGYNYYSLTADASLSVWTGHRRLIQGARAENPNNVLFDDGDVIQGTLAG